jgi:archaellum component FlaC
MIGQLPENESPSWVKHINRKLDRIMALTKDIEAALASLKAIEGEIGIYAADAQARIADLEAKVAEAEVNAADPAAVEALKSELAAFKERADALVAQFPEVQPTEEPVEEPAPEPAEEAPAQ